MFGATYVSPPWSVRTTDEGREYLAISPKVFGFSIDIGQPTHVFVGGDASSFTAFADLLESLGFEIELPDVPVLETDTTLAGLTGFGDTDVPWVSTDDLDISLLDSSGLDTNGLDGVTDSGSLPGLDSEGVPSLPSSTDSGLPFTPPPELDQVPEYLIGVDVTDPGAVATAELNFLILDQGAGLTEPLQTFPTQHGQTALMHEVVIPPGVYLRSIYLPSRTNVVRFNFVSLFGMSSSDITWMAKTVWTDAAAMRNERSEN